MIEKGRTTMSHVDEGALHAYLDGALDEYPAAEQRRVREHLDLCPECAERLEVERAVRADAHAVLGLAEPAVEVPSFEELRAYVERTRPAPSRRSMGVVRWSWAASVILALGVGWMLRGSGVESGPVRGATQRADAEGSGSLLEPEGSSVRGSAVPMVAEAATEWSDAEPTGAIDPDAFDARADLPTRSVASGTGASEADVTEPDVAGSASEAEENIGVYAGRSADAISSDAVSAVDMAADEAAAPVAASEAQESIPADLMAAGPQAGPPANMVKADDGAAGEQGAAVLTERRRAESPTVFTSQFGAERGSVRIVSEEDDRLGDEPLQAVPGFEVVLTENIGDGRAFLGTVTTQRLESEDMMQVFLLEPDVALDVLPDLSADLNEVRVATETGWVVLRGPRSEDELETLLMRLFPG